MLAKIVGKILGGLSRLGSTWNLALALMFLIGSPLVTIGVIGLGFFPVIGSLIRIFLILFCSIGAAVGGLMLRGAMEALIAGDAHRRTEDTWKTREETIRENERQKSEIAVKDRDLQLAREDRLKLELEKAQLQSDKERLERMSIQMDSASPILKLGLMNINMTNYDFQHKIIDVPETLEEDSYPPTFWNPYPPKRKIQQGSDYVGLMRMSMEANLGIDLKLIEVAEYDDTLYVSGIRSESHGISQRKTEWLLKEIRKERRGGNGKVEGYYIDRDDRRTTDLVIEQQNSLDEKLNRSLPFDGYDHMIRVMAEGFIRLLLSPSCKKIEFLSSDKDESSRLLPLQPLQQFIDQYNSEINSQKKLLEQKELQIMRKMLHVAE